MKFGTLQHCLLWYWTRWQSRDQKLKFLKFKMADGRNVENRFLVITHQSFLCSAVATRLHRTTWRETYSGQTRTTRGDDCDRRQLRSCSCVAHDYERSATAPSALLHHASSTTCLLTSFLHRHCPFSSGAWRLICLDNNSADNWPCYLSLKLCLRQDKYCRW